MRNRRRDIWVFIEPDEAMMPAAGSLRLLQAARKPADRNQGSLVALMIGRYADRAAETAAGLGADKIIMINGGADMPGAAGGDLRVYAQMIALLSEEEKPLAILLANSSFARTVAPMTAALTGAAFFADCSGVMAYAKTGQLVFSRFSFGGAVSSKAVSAPGIMQIGVIRTEGLQHEDQVSPADPDTHIVCARKPWWISGEPEWLKLIDSTLKRKSGELDIEEADVIVAGGRGAGGKEGFDLVRELADCLGGAVGASRVAVDKGWIDKSHLIGQSGRTVRPKLYINCGISGSIQHITGMRDAGCVISINSDPKALIFNVSDYGLVGDMFTVIPALIHEIKKRKGG